jgi:uncharacterized protein (DUF427 family)
MSHTLGSSPAALRHPEHLTQLSEKIGCCVVEIGGVQVAESCDTIAVEETGHDLVLYFPPQDVDTEVLFDSDSRTTCPFKGEAHYFAAEIDGKKQDVAWFYPQVYDEVAAIGGYIAFYADRVDLNAS